MNNWFECKVSYEKTMENGKQKRVTEPYLVDALSFTEAEARIIEKITPFISGSFSVAAIKREKISEIFTDETGDRWFKAKVAFVTINEKTLEEKKTVCNMLIQALDIDQAKDNLRKGMKGTLADYVIESLTETKLMDIFPFESKEDTNNESEV